MPSETAIEIEAERVKNYEAAAEAEGLTLDSYNLKRFDGGVAISAVVVPILVATLPFVTKMVIAEIQSKRHVKVKVDGIEIRGLSASDTAGILAKIWAAKAK